MRDSAAFPALWTGRRITKPKLKNVRALPAGSARFVVPLFSKACRVSEGHVVAAVKVGIDVVREDAGLEVPRVAHRGGRAAGNVEVLRKDELDALDQHIPAGRAEVRGNRQRFRAALVFVALLVNLAQRDGERHALAGTDVFQVDGELQDPPRGLEVYVAEVVLQRVCFRESVRVVCKVACRKAVHRGLQLVHRGDELGVLFQAISALVQNMCGREKCAACPERKSSGSAVLRCRRQKTL